MRRASLEYDMRTMNLFLHEPAWSGALTRSADALGSRRSGVDAGHESDPRSMNASPRSPGLLERIDRWFRRQEQRDRERYLAQSQDVLDLEQRIRRLERSVGS